MKTGIFQKQSFGVFLVVFAGVCWGIISFFIRGLTGLGFSSLQIVAIRSMVSAVLLLLGMTIRNPALLRIRFRDIWMFLGTGILSTSFFTYCYYSSIQVSGAAVAVVLLYTAPVFVIGMSALFFRERITKSKTAAIALTFMGCILVAGIVGSGTVLTPEALLFGLGSGFGYALYSVFARFAIRRYSPFTVTFYTVAFSGISMLFLIDCRDTAALIMQSRSSVWYLGLCIALICTVIPYVCYTAGLRSMDAGKAAVLVTVEPMVGSVIGILFYHEIFNFTKVLGVILIFSAVVIAGLPEKRGSSE